MECRKNTGNRGENDTKETFHEVQPLGKIPPKFLQNKPFHRNFIAFVRTQPFVPKRFTGNYSIGSLEFLHFSFVPKGAYFFYPCS
jgi:hypothetical protein